MSVCCIPGIILNVFHLKTHLIFLTTLWSGHYYYHFYFTDEESETQKVDRVLYTIIYPFPCNRLRDPCLFLSDVLILPMVGIYFFVCWDHHLGQWNVTGRDRRPVSVICFKNPPLAGCLLSYNLLWDKDNGLYLSLYPSIRKTCRVEPQSPEASLDPLPECNGSEE